MPLTHHHPGQIWNPAIHGVVIRTESECSQVYDNDGAWFGRFCAQSGIPTGVPISMATHAAIRRAFNLSHDAKLRDAAVAEALIEAAGDHAQVAA